MPLYRQAQIYARQGIALDRSSLADWSGRAAWWLRPLHAKILSELRVSPKLFADETTAPVLESWAGSIAHLEGFRGIPQVDGYANYRTLAERGHVQLAFCWVHVRRRFYEIAAAGAAPIATEALARIAELHAMEAEILGRPADERRAVRSQRAKPVVDDLKVWFDTKLALVSQRGTVAEAIRYALLRWDRLCRFIEDGYVEIASNIVERHPSARPL